MKNLSPVILIVLFALGGCASSYESVLALKDAHRVPDEGETCITRQSRALLRYAEKISSQSEEEPIELEDPVSFCREQIENIAEADLSLPRLRGAAVYILSFTAVSSPSSLVRSEAYRALEKICKPQAKDFDALDPNTTPEEWAALCKRWQAIWGDLPPKVIESGYPGVDEILSRRDSDMKGGRIKTSRRSATVQMPVQNGEEEKPVATKEQIAAAEAFLEEFSGIIVGSSSIAWDSLALLTIVRPPAEGWIDERNLYAKVIDTFIEQTFFLTTCESVFDASPTVSLAAADALFLFDFDDVDSLVRLRMERCYDPSLRMLILKNLSPLHLAPGDLGGKLMSSVRESLDFRDPGVVYHAVELFKNLTGIKENDPSFWRKWWSDHVVEFADG